MVTLKKAPSKKYFGSIHTEIYFAILPLEHKVREERQLRDMQILSISITQ